MVGKIERRDNFQFINGQDERDNLKHEFKLGKLVEILIRRKGFMKSTVDYKMTLYVFVVGCACIGIRIAMSPSFPQTLGFAIGIGLCLVSVALTVWEIIEGHGFFYGFAENWNGYGIVNSGFIAGMSAFFFSRDWRFGIIIVAVLSICTLIERFCIRYSILLIKNAHKDHGN
jgi:hypothetical protein